MKDVLESYLFFIVIIELNILFIFKVFKKFVITDKIIFYIYLFLSD